MVDLEFFGETERNLINRPYTSYLLYKLYFTDCDDDLPSFICRKDEINYLKRKKLIKPIISTHLHFQPTKLTKDGEVICQRFEECGVFKIFDDIPLESKQSFNQHFDIKLRHLQKYSKSIIYDKLVHNIGKLNEWKLFKRIEIRFVNFIPLEINEDNELWRIEYDLKCIFCENVVHQDIEIYYDLNSFKNSTVKIICRSCNSSYYLCLLLNCLYTPSF